MCVPYILHKYVPCVCMCMYVCTVSMKRYHHHHLGLPSEYERLANAAIHGCFVGQRADLVVGDPVYPGLPLDGCDLAADHTQVPCVGVRLLLQFCQLYVCMYVCMYLYVCMYASMSVCIYVCMHVFVSDSYIYTQILFTVYHECMCMYVCATAVTMYVIINDIKTKTEEIV